MGLREIISDPRADLEQWIKEHESSSTADALSLEIRASKERSRSFSESVRRSDMDQEAANLLCKNFELAEEVLLRVKVLQAREGEGLSTTDGN